MSAVHHDDFPLIMEREFGMSEKVPPVLVAFGLHPMKDDQQSAAAGSDVFVDIEHVKIAVPGDRNALYFQPATDQHKKRFPKAYDAFKQRALKPNAGLPVEQWAAITRSVALTLRAANVPTVEALAQVHDAHLDRLGFNARELRDKAKVWLAQREGNAAALKDVAEKNELRQQIAALQAQLTAMQAGGAVEAPKAAKKPAAKVKAAPAVVDMAPPITGAVGNPGAALLHDDIEADVAAAMRRPRSGG